MEQTKDRFVYRHTLARRALCCFFWVLWMMSSEGCALRPTPSIDANRAAQAWIALGREYLVEGDISNARQAFDHARRFDETQPALWHGLALCAQLEQNRPLAHTLYQRALSLAEHAIEDTKINDSEYNNDREYVALLNNHARLLYDEGAIHEACAELDNATRHSGSISNLTTARNLALCRITPVEQPSS